MLSKEKEEKTKCEIQTIKERKGNLDIHKDRYYHQPKPPVERIQSTISSVVTREKTQENSPFNNSILKNLRLGEFNSFIKKENFPSKRFQGPGAKQDS